MVLYGILSYGVPSPVLHSVGTGKTLPDEVIQARRQQQAGDYGGGMGGDGNAGGGGG
jgi:hypothetical protein